MKKLGSHEIRKIFLDFFKEKGHLVEKSFSLVPKNDKSLLLINAGMAPLKSYFLGTEQPPSKKMATCQKCIRTGDIDNVGKTARHGTFFEMLGNFSFGDYFKREAINLAWELMTERLELPAEKLWVSVYLEDDEAYDIWNKEIGISKDRIVRLGKEDNFWELEVGPSGPCTEIYIDRGEKYGCGSPDCKPGCDCDRYLEIWNLVFSQYDKDEKGNYNPLESKNIDTGMGLERISAVMQDTDNIFEIDTMQDIIKEVESITGKKYVSTDKDGMSFRVITDHIRAMTFLVSDGVIPSNEGRGYVLRRLIRRAARHGKLLGIKGLFLNELAIKVINSWGEAYPDLKEREAQIRKIIKVEEEKFEETIDQGINILNEYIKEVKANNKDILDGHHAFKLYDTYGFPLDLTKEILEEYKLTVDENEFNIEMEKQRQRARKAREEGDNHSWNTETTLNIDKDIKTIFEGYENLSLDTKISVIVSDKESENVLKAGEQGIVLLERTPFYAEGGGQAGDTGTITTNKVKAEVVDTKKGQEGQIIHIVKVIEGTLEVGQKVIAEVDVLKRVDTARNHSVTHILHQALKDVIGEHVNQAGSLVLADRMRFDFTHFEGVSRESLDKIEDIVNSKILEGLSVDIVETTLDEARNMGAQALFNEKYGDKVRLVKIGEYSKELCGGTHIKNSSQIGLFKILSEAGIASGVRRIEAVTGLKAYEYVKELEQQIYKVSELLKGNKKDIINKIQTMVEEHKSLEKEIGKLKSELTLSKLDDIINSAIKVEGISVICKRIDDLNGDSLRQLGDKIKDKLGSVLIVLGSSKDDKVSFISMATKDLIGKGIHAGNIIREVAKIAGGGGGGRPDMAQAGGKHVEKIDEALSVVSDIVKAQLK
ncbi:alanyl-tRNA ligase AlaS [Gottschalkia acidurici 9a]|uniref:Alanine--tRNA ligase n=1 Tax=Gottschalkia acidurici (strain ATCC 7906 / DSM 604 / BCRC 14475 / CIP 104303 / KCTC 5404 / NCIMB 10678 / 9a) TaxID=1128398 RepID=K0B130_GOTA9|nr:alanine--tRNA ligase [Gottschalkia acidurici]AFS78346.1 alanyl-tRNA ligase AlaS [Gottschalkia acidurici 9a]